MATLLEAGRIWIEDEFVPDSQTLFESLAASVAWDETMRARRAASFGLPYNYSGVVWPETPFPVEIARVLERVAVRLGYRPSNCLANYYSDGRSSMGFHADATDDLEDGTGIAVVSFGAERVISFRSQTDKKLQEHYPLRSGSLLFMCPEMQRDWKHAILADENVPGGRISLTFRRMKSLDSSRL